MKYDLFYKEIRLGSITRKGSDFPSLFGQYSLLPFLKLEPSLLNQYITYSIQANQMMENQSKWIEFIEKEEHKYAELIDSEDWKLIDKDGKSHKTLIPIFCENNEIIWRWNS